MKNLIQILKANNYAFKYRRLLAQYEPKMRYWTAFSLEKLRKIIAETARESFEKGEVTLGKYIRKDAKADRMMERLAKYKEKFTIEMPNVLKEKVLIDIFKDAGISADKVLGGVAPAFDIYSPEVMKAVDNFCNKLIRDVYLTPTDDGLKKLLKYGLKEGMHPEQISDMIAKYGGLNGKDMEQIIRLLEQNKDMPKAQLNKLLKNKTMQFDQRRARTIARTETAKALTEGATMRWEERGVEYVEFSSAVGCCEECEALDGRRFPIDEAEGVCPVHPNCTCALLPVVGV